jgi:lipoprotein-releasing system ATP-binding protein
MNDDLEQAFGKAQSKKTLSPRKPFALRVRGGPTLDGGPHIDFSQVDPSLKSKAPAPTTGPTRTPLAPPFAAGSVPLDNARPTPQRQRVEPNVIYRNAEATDECQLRAVNLKKSYAKGPAEVAVLKGVDLEVRRGEFLAIIGQSGSGKSTLLHLLGTLDAPDHGEIHFNGMRIDRLAGRQRDRLRNRSFGMIFQFYHLLPELTTLENVLMPLMITHSAFHYFGQRNRCRQQAQHLLEMLGLGHRLKHKSRELSGGEMQRTAIARALVANPELLLADEPTGNLDQTTGQEILEILFSLNHQQNLTIVMVTHDPAIARRADRVVRLADGRVEPEGGRG